MDDQNTKLFDREKNPWRQFVMAVCVLAILNAGMYVLQGVGLMTVELEDPWIMSSASVLLFGVSLSVMSLSTDRLIWYWSRAVYAFFGLLVLSVVVAGVLSGSSILELRFAKIIYITIVFCFLTFVSIISAIRNVINWSQKQKDKRSR